MFDKFHLTFNFKSKVSHDVFKNTSRKYCGKKPVVVFSLRFFRPPWSAVAKRFAGLFVCLFGLPTENLGAWGVVMYQWKGLENSFPTAYYTPQNFWNYNRKTEKKNLQSFNSHRSGWSKEPQWENNCGSFFAISSTSEMKVGVIDIYIFSSTITSMSHA
jgi:hypothetical protein